MNTLFEYNDRLNAPYECFIYESANDEATTRAHWHYFMEIIYMINGSAQVLCDSVSHQLKEGDMMLFLPQQIHSIFPVQKEQLKYYVLKFDTNQLTPSTSAYASAYSGIHFGSLMQCAKGNPAAHPFLDADSLKAFPIRKLFDSCYLEMSGQEYGYRLMMQAKINTLLTYIVRIWRKNGFDTDKALAGSVFSNSIHTITEYIDTHTQEQLKVEELAELCHMSYSYFAKSFRNLYGQSCKKYIEFVRLCKAEDLLLFTNLDLNYISQETGFSDCSHFIKAFRQKHGMTPKQFRKSHLDLEHDGKHTISPHF